MFNILMYFTFFFLLIVTVIVLLAKVYNKEIKQYAVSYLNDYLTAQVHVDNIELDLLKRFPQATLVFKNVHIEDINNEAEGDTMLFARELLLKFNFWEIFDGKYNITHIEAKDAKLNLSVSSEGQENYLIWKTHELAAKKEFQFNLEEVICANTVIKYSNVLTNQSYACNTSLLNLTGAFTQSTFDLDIKSQMVVNAITVGDLTYIKNENTLLNTVIKVDKPNRKYTIVSCKAEISGLNFDISGDYLADTSFCDLKIAGNNLQLNKVFTVFPSVFFEKFAAYQSDGILDFNASVVGVSSKTSLPEVNASFSIADGKLTEVKTGMKLNDVQLNGTFTNADFGELDIRNLSGTLLNSTFSGSMNLQNFDTPDVDVQIKGKLDLNSLQQFFRFESLTYLNGKLDFDVNVKGKSEDGTFKPRKSGGSFEMAGVNLKTTINELEYTNLNGRFLLKNGDAYISNCSGNIFNSDFNVAGVLRNFLPFILSKNQLLTIEADLDSKFIDLSQITRMAASANKSRGGAPESILPTYLAFNLNTVIGKLQYGKFDAENLRGVTKLQNQVLTGQNVRFKGNGGTYKANFEFDGSNPNNYLFTADAKARKIDITDFFSEFDNFGQTFIQHQHIKGRANAQVNFACALDNGFIIKQESILSSLDLNLTKGELMNLEILQEIALYLENNKLIKPYVDTKLMAEKLRHITFSDLSNKIEIRNQRITIPRMTIKSSVMDIGIKGEHGFNDSINYGFSFRLRDVLMKDRNREDFGPIVDDGTGLRIFLSMTGTVDDPIFGIDKSEKKLARKEKVIMEKKNMKAILKQELGLFKKDTTVGTYQKPKKPEVKFEYDWNDTDTTVNSVEDEFTPEKRDKRRNGFKDKIKKLESRWDKEKKADTILFEIEEDDL
ncbi:MAG: hypothetical protein JKY54_15480 [Flavobacteriales bacterium]|nr:hypothetical protein [Flavobacteriales bacterium]